VKWVAVVWPYHITLVSTKWGSTTDVTVSIDYNWINPSHIYRILQTVSDSYQCRPDMWNCSCNQ